MNIGTWNVQGIATKTEKVLREIKKYDTDIVGFTETKKKGRGSEERNGYIHIYSGVPKEERARSGVSIAIKNRYKKNITSWEQISDRILKVQMELKSHVVIIVVAYAPNDDADMVSKDVFYVELTKSLEKVSDRKELLLVGDLNALDGEFPILL